MKHITLAILTIFLSCGHIGGTNFDSNKWKNFNLNEEENWNLRWNMINDLRNNYSLIGKNKTDIINLLGESNSESSESNKMYYYLGYTGHGINTGSLILLLDNNNNVTKIIVREG